MSAGIAGATVIGLGSGVLSWWQVLALALPATGLADWTGSQIGRIDGIRAARLEPGERVLGTYAVRPPYTEHTPPWWRHTRMKAGGGAAGGGEDRGRRGCRHGGWVQAEGGAGHQVSSGEA
ncbi:hypothetical protein [Streptomyces sp. NBC_01174]|uniref:hypothetical protein n=1 Tax=Streptomyces sp. NBC_01174 TaxID=2903758 RepID=UPI002F90DD50|nr:hypothetical protein OG414_40105 [Streptomyces sp. NBC_01174]